MNYQEAGGTGSEGGLIRQINGKQTGDKTHKVSAGRDALLKRFARLKYH